MRPQTIEVLGRSVRVLTVDGHGDPVLLLHGLGGWAEQWRETMSTLAARGFTAHAVDLPGYGRSVRFPRADHFHPERALYVRFVEGLLDVLGIARTHLVGHSLGGVVAYLAAVSIPDRVSSLTMVAGAGIDLALPWPMRLGSLPGMGLVLRLFGRRYARAALASCFADVSRVPSVMWTEADEYVPPAMDEVARVLRAGLTVRGIRRRLHASWIERAHRYRGPVLVAWGELDAVLPAIGAHRARDLFPQAEIHLIPDGGHMVMVEQASAFEAALLPFLGRAAPAARREPLLPWRA